MGPRAGLMAWKKRIFRVPSVVILLNELPWLSIQNQLKFQQDNVRGKNIFIDCAVYRVFHEE